MAATNALSAMPIEGHRLWARLCHWLLALSFLGLAFSGFVILMAHPRLYWGEVGNAMTPALIEFPLNDNHRPEGWQQAVVFDEFEGAPVSGNRMYRIFNENRWARSLHFLSGWMLFFAGAVYVFAGVVTGHIRRNLLPRIGELAPRAFFSSVTAYARQRFRDTRIGPPYSLPQRLAYAGVVFVFLPFMVISGLTMAPSITAAYPVLLDIFGGYQSARTLHFAGFGVLALFLVAHLAMVTLTGFRRQLRAMILGS